jgi:hypothetical protein
MSAPAKPSAPPTSHFDSGDTPSARRRSSTASTATPASAHSATFRPGRPGTRTRASASTPSPTAHTSAGRRSCVRPLMTPPRSWKQDPGRRSDAGAGRTPPRPRPARTVEVRPRHIGEVQLRVRALPQHEIAQPLLAARADQQVHVRHRLHERPPPGGVQLFPAPRGVRRRPHDGVPGRIVDGQPQTQKRARRRRAFGRGDGVLQRAGSRSRRPSTSTARLPPRTTPAPPAGSSPAAAAARALPGPAASSCPTRTRTASARRSPGTAPPRPPAGPPAAPDAVARTARQPSRLRPAPVAVHDDGDVQCAAFPQSALFHKVHLRSNPAGCARGLSPRALAG